MKKAADELGVTYKAQGPNSESDIADQVNMINTAIARKAGRFRSCSHAILLPFLMHFRNALTKESR
ncbi:hypothetical protein M5E86_11485 [Blautia wexlerae]|nr:hypothetical protein M5E86_11485 [Blautia wexlerae]